MLIWKRMGAYALAGVMLSACATTSTNPAADPRLQTSEAKFFSQSGLEACAMSAGAGALAYIAAQKIKNESIKNEGLAVSAVAGCAVGAGVNYYLDVKRAQNQNEQSRISAEIDDVQKDNQKLASYIATTKQVVAEDKQEIEAITAGLKESTMTKEQAEARLVGIDANREELEKTLGNLKERAERWNAVAEQEKAAGADTTALDAEIKTLETQVASLQSELDDLNNYRSVVKTA